MRMYSIEALRIKARMPEAIDHLQIEEHALFDRHAQDAVKVVRRGHGDKRAFSGDDLRHVALLSLVETIIAYRGDPVRDEVETFGAIVRQKANFAIANYYTINCRVLSFPVAELRKARLAARNGEPLTRLRLRLLHSERVPLSKSGQRENVRTGRSGQGILPLRQDDEDDTDIEEHLSRVRSALETAAQLETGARRDAALLMLNERLRLADPRERMTLETVAARSGLTWEEVRQLERALFRTAQRILRGEAVEPVIKSADAIAVLAGCTLYAARWALMEATAAFVGKVRKVAMLVEALRMRCGPSVARGAIARRAGVKVGVVRKCELQLWRLALAAVSQGVAA